MNKFKYINIILKYILAKLLCVFIMKSKKYDDIWLISERGDEARDNGYIFYKYVKEKHKEINIKYVIKKTSPDFNKIERYGDVVEYGRLKHYLLFIKAEKLISTHIMGYSPHKELFEKLQRKQCFLQHGIIKDWLPQLCYPNVKLNLFICGALPEYEYVQHNFKHPNKVVQYTGLARFDELYDIKLKKQVLVMPTWRMYLWNLSEEQFINSKYYKELQKILINNHLIKTLEKYNYELVFYPHYEIQKYINLFTSFSNKIKIASFHECDIQELLKESSLLITDYSSVFFDFAYMEKPIIYYQFDKEEYFDKHYKEGYFDYDKSSFGEVVSWEEDLIKSISRTLDKNCELDGSYQKRIDEFFVLKDKDNCERIFNEILDL